MIILLTVIGKHMLTIFPCLSSVHTRNMGLLTGSINRQEKTSTKSLFLLQRSCSEFIASTGYFHICMDSWLWNKKKLHLNNFLFLSMKGRLWNSFKKSHKVTRDLIIHTFYQVNRSVVINFKQVKIPPILIKAAPESCYLRQVEGHWQDCLAV